MKNITDPEKVISPKVIATAVVTIIGTAVLAAGAALTPDLFAWAGPWAPVLFAGVVGGLGALAGYITRDPLRR